MISFFLNIGDYGFCWCLYLDGTNQLEVEATGVVFTSACTGPDGFATGVAPGLGAPFHQHLFCARLDFELDGPHSAVDEVDVERVPIGPGQAAGAPAGRKFLFGSLFPSVHWGTA